MNEFSPLLFDSVSGRGGSAGTPGNFAASAKETGGPPITGGPWPCQKPPWGRLNAVNANTGEIAWRVTVGITDELPEGKPITGRPGVAGPMVTAGGLVFLGSTNDARFRAFDAKTGKELWITKMEYTGNANPMTYRGKNGKQYVALVAAGMPAAGAPANRQAVMVYALP